MFVVPWFVVAIFGQVGAAPMVSALKFEQLPGPPLLAAATASIDGRWIALAGGEVWLVDAATGKDAWRWMETARQVRFAPTSDWLVIEQKDHLIGLNVTDGSVKFKIPARTMRGVSLAISTDGRLLAFCEAEKKQLVLWNVIDQKAVATYAMPARDEAARLHLVCYADLRFTPDGKRLLLLYKANGRRNTNETLLTLFTLPELSVESETKLTSWPYGVEFIPDSQRFLLLDRAGLKVGTIREQKIDLRDYAPKLVDEINELAIHPDGTQLAFVRKNFRPIDAVGRSVLDGCSLHIIDLESGKELGRAPVPDLDYITLPPRELAFAEKGRSLVYIGAGPRKYSLPEK